MKRILIFATMILMVIGVQAEGIQVLKPGSGFTVYKGGTTGFMIQWSAVGDIHAKVKIRIYDKTGTNQISIITNSTNTITGGTKGQFHWPQNMIDNTAPGEYVVRVRSLDNAHSDDSDVFQIRKKLLNPEKIKEFAEKVQEKPKLPISKDLFRLKPDLAIAIGPNIQPPNYDSYFNIVISNIGKVATPKPTREKFILYYWGEYGNSKPSSLMDLIMTDIPVIGAGSNHVHVITYKFQNRGKYSFTICVNVSDGKNFEESNIHNNSGPVGPTPYGKEFWVNY